MEPNTLIPRRQRQINLQSLFFPVVKEPLQFVSKEARANIEGDCGIAVVRGDTGHIIQTASTDYNLVLHEDIINMVEAVFKANKVEFQVHDVFTGGIQGNKMFVNYTLPGYKMKINGEEYIPFVQFQNSYDKSALFKNLSGLYRLVCSNGLVRFHSRKTLIKARHYGNTIDLSKIAFNLDEWLVEMDITKFKLEELVKKPITKEVSIEDLTKKIFQKKKDVKAFMESNLVPAYIEELGNNQYALMNAYTDFTTHVLSSRMKNFDRVAKSFAAIENIFLN
jgi:hypothetical protein